ncbi:hypothetical protein CDL12_26029 [Handroanthus impetiginosus]|uniref:NAB domain-containing protein n=1 Tax=Handroanthus impetiginosus TaxID=429701 RepID=A0A2G9G901_9LAMI|nr:hypothetical protein CDL12_26029 [Handroanthus impetiginosus]
MENEVRNFVSPWWNSQICLENSEWLAENVKGVDQSVQEMLMLIEHDGDSIDSNHPKQSELIARIKEISERHHLLADHYSKLTGELSSHVQLANEMKNYEKTTFTTPFHTPDKKLGMHNVDGQVVSSDLSSGGGISDTTPNEGSESSSLSSDSDSESYNSSANERSSSIPSGKMLKHEMLLRQISEYENELTVSNQKFQTAQEEIAKLMRELQNNEEVMVKMGSLEAQLVSAKNQIKLQEAEIEKENKRSLLLQGEIVELEAKLESEKRQVQELQESITKYTAELSDRDLEIRRLNAELQNASGNFALEKRQIESSVSKLSESLIFHEARIKELQTQCESLADQIKKSKSEKVEMERNQEALKISWQDDIDHVKEELCEKNLLVDTLNQNLDGLKLKYDMLMAKKDGVNAKLQTLSAALSVRDDQIQSLEHNLHELHSENKRLNADCDGANMLTTELKSRIDEIEKEVGMQAIMISDTSEQKREAIRQLCFSIDHFRRAYEELRNTYVLHKRPTAMVS